MILRFEREIAKKITVTRINQLFIKKRRFIILGVKAWLK